MLVTTMDHVPGKRIARVVGLVRGNTIRARHLGKDVMAVLRNLVGDRAFCSYAHLALLLQSNLHAVVRAHQRINIDFTPGRLSRSQRPRRQRVGVPTSTRSVSATWPFG